MTISISEIRNIHPPVADLVCQRIREQGNEPDESKDMDTDMEHGGFDWDNTPERHMPWKAIHYDHNFEPLFSLYPELRGEGKKGIDTEEAKKEVQEIIESQIRIAREMKMADYNLATMIRAELELKGCINYKQTN